MKTRLVSISFLFALAFVAITGINAKVATELNLTVESDPELKIEGWMVQEDYWTASSVRVTPEVEEDLELEQWMIDDCYWK